MGYRISLTVEELGELSGAITKGKPKEEIAEEHIVNRARVKI